MTDFIFMVKDSSYMFVTGPDVVKTVTTKRSPPRNWAARSPTPRKSGVADLAFENDVDALVMLRRFFNYLPLNNREKPPIAIEDRTTGGPTTSRPRHAGAGQPNKPYDMKELILKMVDDGDFFEIQPDHAKNIVIGFAAWKARPWASSPTSRWCWPGALDIKSSIKAARFVRFCDAFNIPVITFVDVPGFMPGHRAGIRRHHQARRQAALRLRRMHVPKITVITQGLWRGLRRHGLQSTCAAT